MRWWEKLSIFGGLVFGLISRDEITEEDIERLKEGDMLESTFAEFAAQSEGLYNALIAERDHFMAAKLREAGAAHRDILAVVGAGHLKGLANQLKTQDAEPNDIVNPLNEVPARSWFLRALPWLITAVILAGFWLWFFAKSRAGLVLGWDLDIDQWDLGRAGCIVSRRPSTNGPEWLPRCAADVSQPDGCGRNGDSKR